MKDGHYSRPVWADDGWLAKYAGKTLDEDNVGADGGVSAEYVPGATATIGKHIFMGTVMKPIDIRITKTAQISENSGPYLIGSYFHWNNSLLYEVSANNGGHFDNCELKLFVLF